MLTTFIIIVASKKTITKIPEFKIRLAWNGLHESLNRIGRISRISYRESEKTRVPKGRIFTPEW